MWLITDMHGQGKDLHDAVLLAERQPLRYALLHEVFRLSGEWPSPQHEQRILLEDVAQALLHVEWGHFVTEYPQFKDAERKSRAGCRVPWRRPSTDPLVESVFAWVRGTLQHPAASLKRKGRGESAAPGSRPRSAVGLGCGAVSAGGRPRGR